ncbi:hypothetical protein H0H87_004599, partial [Tephrocybe sp. NHM501043]
MANQASHNIFKALAVKDTVNRYVSKSELSVEELPNLLELLSVDIAAAQSMVYELDRPQGIQIASSLLHKVLKHSESYRRFLNSNDREAQVILDGCQE